MQAIETKYLRPTSHRGSRIKATCARGSATIPFPQELNNEDAHRAAVTHLTKAFAGEDTLRYTSTGLNPWLRPFVTATLKNGNYVHILVRS